MIHAASCWADRADELAEFTFLHLPNRLDIWGAYLPIHKRSVNEDGREFKSLTAPSKTERGSRSLDLEVIRRHYRGADVGHVIGLHTTSPANTSRFLAFDFDNHDGTVARASANLAAAQLLVEALALFGLAALIEDSDGRGGLHVWVIFAEPAPTLHAHALARAVLKELALHAETYPKQGSLPNGKCGNWLRLPGRHHTRDHWSRFMVGQEWRDGEDAVDLWLNAWTSPIDRLPVPAAPRVAPAVASRVRCEHSGTDAARRAQAYLAKLPTRLGVGDGRNDAGYTFACFLVRDLAVDDREALGWLSEWNRGNAKPLSAGKLESLVREAHEYGQHAYGSAA